VAAGQGEPILMPDWMVVAVVAVVVLLGAAILARMLHR
jgi:hypothetical protein